MKNINETVKSKYLIYILFLAGGLLLGWLLFHNSDTDSHTSQASETGTEVHDPTHGHDLQQNEAGEWTCSMHIDCFTFSVFTMVSFRFSLMPAKIFSS